MSEETLYCFKADGEKSFILLEGDVLKDVETPTGSKSTHYIMNLSDAYKVANRLSVARRGPIQVFEDKGLTQNVVATVNNRGQNG